MPENLRHQFDVASSKTGQWLEGALNDIHRTGRNVQFKTQNADNFTPGRVKANESLRTAEPLHHPVRAADSSECDDFNIAAPSGNVHSHGLRVAIEYKIQRINTNPAWRKRLTKSYTANRFVPRAQDRRRFELDCATSSDALLMNLFCYPRVLMRPALCALLNIEPGLSPEFGFRPAFLLANGHADRTEVDMKLGSLLVEAKLTEADFQRAPLRLLSRYRDLTDVFDTGLLPVRDGVVHSWQLIRGVLAAHATDSSFCVFCDGRRPDLIDRWFEVMRAVTDSSLRTRLGILTWQEISATLPKPLRIFLDEKYGI